MLHDRFLAKLKRNVESPDVEEAARSALEQAAVVHLEVCAPCLCVSVSVSA